MNSNAQRGKAVRRALMAGLIPLLAACGGNELPATAFTLQVLHVSDADGSDSIALDSVAHLSGLVTKFKAERPNNTLIVSSGDNYIPGPRFNASDSRAPADMRTILGREGVGRADIAFLNELGVQASVVGNHELDLGVAIFADIIKPQVSSGSVVWAGAKFPYLSYNVDFSADSNTAGIVGTNGSDPAALAGKVAGWTTVTVGGQRIGVIGASSSTFTRITSTGNLGFSPALNNGEENIDALAAVLQTGVDAMTAAGIDKIVLLAHMQKISTEKALAAKLRGVDIIVAGGSNTLMADSNDVLRSGDTARETYPFITRGADNNAVAVVNVDADYKYLGRLVMPFDARGQIIPERLDSQLNGPVATSMTDDTAGGVTPIAKVQEIRNALKSIINTKDGEFYGFTNVFLEGRRSFVRTEETNAGNIAADAQLWYAQQVEPGVQIALKNGGGIRAEIGKVNAVPGTTEVSLIAPEANVSANRPAGAVSRLMLETSYKFNNQLWVFDISADKLLAVLNHGVADVANVAGRFPQVAGLSFSFDPARPAGQRVRSVKVGNDVVARDGVVQGIGSRTFRIVTMNFLATGGDGYAFGASPTAAATETELATSFNLRKLTSESAASLGGRVNTLAVGTEQDSLAEYLAAFHATAQAAYNQAETPASSDTRIQDLSKRTDTVLAP